MSANTVRQVIAEALLVFDLGLLCFIVVHLRREVRRRGFALARTRLGNQAAVAVGVHILGLTLIRSWTTYLYWANESGVDTSGAEDAYPLAMVGLVIAMVGMACCIRIFSPVRWGNWGWILTFCAALGFVGFMQSG